MNIAIVTTWLERGAAYVSKAYLETLQRQGHEVSIYARGGEEYATGDPLWDLPNVTWPKRYAPLGRVSNYNKMYIDMGHFEKWLRRNDIEIVIFNEEHDFRTVNRTHDLGYTIGAYIDYYKKNTISSFRVYDFLLCNTKRHHSVFSTFPNCLYIPWGTDTKLFKPIRERATGDSGEPVVFFHSAGRAGVNLRKGTDLLLQAFVEVHGDAKLIVQSQSPLGDYGDLAAEIVTADDRITFLEKTVSAPGLYHLGDVFVYPSRLEGIGLCVPEALSCGLPVITTDCAPMNEFVTDGVNGSLVQLSNQRQREDGYYWPESIVDVKDLTKNMQAYVDDRNLLEVQKLHARRNAKSSLDWFMNSKELGQSLHALLEPPDRRRRSNTVERCIWWIEATYVNMLTCIGRTKNRILPLDRCQ